MGIYSSSGSSRARVGVRAVGGKGRKREAGTYLAVALISCVGASPALEVGRGVGGEGGLMEKIGLGDTIRGKRARH